MLAPLLRGERGAVSVPEARIRESIRTLDDSGIMSAPQELRLNFQGGMINRAEGGAFCRPVFFLTLLGLSNDVARDRDHIDASSIFCRSALGDARG